MTKKEKNIYFIGTKHDNCNYELIECSPDKLGSKVNEWLKDNYVDDDDVRLYEGGRKGILPTREIIFI